MSDPIKAFLRSSGLQQPTFAANSRYAGLDPVIATIQQNGMEDPPELIVQSFSVDDGIDGYPGNGNGVIERNEYVDLQLILSNSGGIAATGVSATLSSSDTAITVVVSKSYFEDISPGDPQTCLSAFRIFIADSAYRSNHPQNDVLYSPIPVLHRQQSDPVGIEHRCIQAP